MKSKNIKEILKNRFVELFDVKDVGINIITFVFLLFGYSMITAIYISGLDVSDKTFKIIVLGFIIVTWLYGSFYLILKVLKGIFSVAFGIAIIGFALMLFKIVTPLPAYAGFIGGVGAVICLLYQLSIYFKTKKKKK